MHLNALYYCELLWEIPKFRHMDIWLGLNLLYWTYVLNMCLLPVGLTLQTGEELQTSFGSSSMIGSGTVSNIMTKNFQTAETQWEELKSEISSSQDSITSGSSWIKTAHMPYTATFTATFVKSYSLPTSSSLQPMATITSSPSTFTSSINFKGDDHSRPDKVVIMSVSRSETNSTQIAVQTHPTSTDNRSETCDCQQENVFGISCHEASTVVIGLAVTLICYFLITLGCLFCYCNQQSRINGKIQISKLGEENAKLKIKVEKLETAIEQLQPGRSDTSREVENPEGNSGSSKMPDIENKLCSAVNTIDLINASEVCKNDAENQERFWTEKVFKVNEAGRTYRKKGKKIQKERCLEKTGNMTLNSTVGSGYLSVRQPPDDNEPDNNSIVMPCVENQSSDLSRL